VSRTKLSKRQIGWNAMIADAQERIQKLQVVISVCEEKIKEWRTVAGNTEASNTELAHYRNSL
jgi:hypothetical protein